MTSDTVNERVIKYRAFPYRCEACVIGQYDVSDWCRVGNSRYDTKRPNNPRIQQAQEAKIEVDDVGGN